MPAASKFASGEKSSDSMYERLFRVRVILPLDVSIRRTVRLPSPVASSFPSAEKVTASMAWSCLSDRVFAHRLQVPQVEISVDVAAGQGATVGRDGDRQHFGGWTWPDRAASLPPFNPTPTTFRPALAPNPPRPVGRCGE